VVGFAVPQLGQSHSAAGGGSAALGSGFRVAEGTDSDGAGTSSAIVMFGMGESRKGGLALM
jgi:hypothetical protein